MLVGLFVVGGVLCASSCSLTTSTDGLSDGAQADATDATDATFESGSEASSNDAPSEALSEAGCSGGQLTCDFCPASVCHVCFTELENTAKDLACPAGMFIREIVFASYGTPTGSCGAFAVSSCSASSSVDVVAMRCLDQPSCTLGADNGAFGDPCPEINKSLSVEVRCGS